MADDPFAGVASPVSSTGPSDPFAGVASPVKDEGTFQAATDKAVGGGKVSPTSPIPIATGNDLASVGQNAMGSVINTVLPYFMDKDPNRATAGRVGDVIAGGASGAAQSLAGLATLPADAIRMGLGYPAEYLANKTANMITGKNEPPDYPSSITAPVMSALNYEPQSVEGNRAKLAAGFIAPTKIGKVMDTVLPEKAAIYDSMKTMRDISGSFNDAIDKANTFYGFPQQLAEGQSVRAPQIAQHLDNVIDDVNNAPWHEAKSQVGTLQRIRDSLPEDGTVPVNDLLDLRKFTNKFFNPARMTDKSATYGQLNAAVDSGLNTAKQTVPNFGPALDIADNYWRNNVTAPFLKNKVLLKAWSPEDAHNLRMVDEGYLDEPGDLTQQRANNLINTVKDVPSYNAIRRTLSDETGPAFDTAVLKSMPSGRVQAAGKFVANTATGHFPSALRNAGDVLNPSRTPDQTAVIKAVKGQNTYTPLSTKNDVAQAAYENLMKANMMGQGHPLALPEPSVNFGPTKALPAPGEPPTSPGQPQITNEFYAPDSRALTYQPKADFEVSPEGWTSKPPTITIRQNPDLQGQASNAKQATARTSSKVAPKQLTYKPRPDLVATKEGITEVTPPGQAFPYTLGEAQGLPIDVPGELNAIRKPYKKGGISKPPRPLPKHLLPEDRPVRWGGRA